MKKILLAFCTIISIFSQSCSKERFNKDKKALLKQFRYLDSSYYNAPKGTVQWRDSLFFKKHKLLVAFTKKYPNEKFCFKTLKKFKLELNKKQLEQGFNLLSNGIKTSKLGKHLKYYIDLKQDLKLNDHYIDFSMKDTLGQLRTISKLRKRYTLVQFWASWCRPCLNHSRDLVEIHNKYASENFEIVGISLDDSKKDWIDAINTYKLKWTHLSELNGRYNTASIIYAVSGIPDNVLIDPDGKIIARDLQSYHFLDKALDILINKNYNYYFPFVIKQNDKDTLIHLKKPIKIKL